MGIDGLRRQIQGFLEFLPSPQCYLEGEKVTFSECLLHPKSILPTAFLLLYLTLSTYFDEKAGAQRGEVTCPGSQLWVPIQVLPLTLGFTQPFLSLANPSFPHHLPDIQKRKPLAPTICIVPVPVE